ncbi:MAG: hypothetical protein JSR72_17370 [Proteobacteria bacterium]|nr:hypothetical protein [Pseudomonadota bacterium]
MYFTTEETCKYLRDTAAQLALLSADSRLFTLSYIFSVAQMEAATRLAELEGVPLLGVPTVPEDEESRKRLMAFVP